jgi:hypothetical protein
MTLSSVEFKESLLNGKTSRYGTVAANILNNQSRIAEKGWCCTLNYERGDDSLNVKKF